MGGHAFLHTGKNGEPSLNCPRVPTVVYEAMCDWVVERLRKNFLFACVPLPHPQKDDHGDIDMYVSGPISESSGKGSMLELEDDIAVALDAKRHYTNQIGVAYFGVPVPKHVAALAPPLRTIRRRNHQIGSDTEYYIQVDITFVSAPSQLEWYD
jgi:hypothetical protein